MMLLNLVNNETSFMSFINCCELDDFFTSTGIGPEVLIWTIKVLSDNSVSCRENVLGRAIILLKQDGVSASEIFAELRDVSNIRSTEGID